MQKKGYRITLNAKILFLKLLLCSLGVFFGFTWKVHLENQKWDNLVYPNITVANIDISGKTKDESIDIIYTNYITPLISTNVNLVANNNTICTMEYSKLIESHDLESVIDNAFAIGKDLSLLEKFFLQKQGLFKNLNINFNYNNNYIDDLVRAVQENVNSQPVDANIRVTTDGNIELFDDIKGYTLHATKLKEYIKNTVISESDNNINIDFAITEIAAPITAHTLSSIDTNIYSFKTIFNPSLPERTNNIKLAINSINGTVLGPGETFSFNDCLGERTAERGYMVAPVIINGSFDNGLGGGICQVSSTLYNAILGIGISDFERRHHSLPTSYVGLGLDATIDWGNIDLKFKNTLEYPILIQGYVNNNNIIINIYSNSSLTKKKYVISNDVYKIVQPTTKTITDFGLPEGKLLVHQKGSTGYRVRVTRNTYDESEVLINSELISDDFYEPMTRIVKIGSRNIRK